MRIPPIEPGTRPELAKHEAQLIAERGRVSLLYQVLLNSPPVAHGWEQLLSAVRNRNTIDPGVRELIILRVAVLNGAMYEFDAHVPHALKAGVSQQAIDAVRDFKPGSPAFTEEQSVALELTDAMTRDIVVPDELYQRATRALNEHQKVDILVTVAAYNMVSRFLIAAQMTH
jgi:AhpD family alkylhydroperoxidase